MANYDPQKPGHTEATITYRTPAGGSPSTDTFTNDGMTLINFKNTDASHVCTVNAAGNCSHGFAHGISVTIPATTGNIIVGPFDTARFGETTTIAWGASVTGVTFALLSTGGTVTGVA
jgi:hypothetical protein